MKRVSDFKPLKRVLLPELGPLECTGLVLIVGPNSSGKSQLLQDLYHRVAGQPRKLVVAEAIDVEKPADIDPFIECLVNDGYMARLTDGGVEQLRPQTTYVGFGQSGNQISVPQARQWWATWDAAAASETGTSGSFLGHFGRFLVTALFLDRRLMSLNQVSMFDHESTPPQNELQALYINDAARAELLAETIKTFSKAVWPDASRGSLLCLRVSDDPSDVTPPQMLSPTAASRYRTIETEGDGLKSYVATCLALLLGRRPLCLLDEPELCLHPPQAHNLGRFIGHFGADRDRATVVATHSSHILRGVIEATQDLQIIRLNRRGSAFAAHRVPSTVIADVLKKPTVRAEAVLDGIFAESVIVVEADGDRTVYQAALETLGNEVTLDIHFTAVGGVGGIADTCRLYAALRIPVAVIADLDIVTQVERLEAIVSVLADEQTNAGILQQAKLVAAAVKALPPEITAESLREQLDQACALEMDWSKNDDAALRSKLSELAKALDRMRRIKAGGLAALPQSLGASAASLVASLAAIGLFVVPVGELEGWLASWPLAVSKQRKSAWANAAATKIREVGAQSGDVWAFTRMVAAYLTEPPT